ncbi:DUF3369 domain-containing protein [Psychrosphaera ytuae]|uniref:DUF3369 domain-containing protein n=1 Tax=Psychrosphaera ytuae TaxID=2820710 RepID=A0A975DC44_9GAMM|nr:HD domain-containing phosphohydrolase [Psychrosphaera ytuae]QTH64148.1 DUF3369 domain-containing protein [Psychrosphaera ytuae]
MTLNDESPLFSMEEITEEFVEKQIEETGWKILIVDDEESIHNVTELALSGFTFAEKPLTFLHAYSAKEAEQVLKREPDIAVTLLDVVMESESAGLDLVDVIRTKLDNHHVRIILRTGQPGQAPEYDVIKKYDINDYKEKTELTNQKLNTVIYSALRSYRDITAINRTRMGLEQIIDATASLLQIQSFKTFAKGTLQQMAAMMHIDAEVVIAETTTVFAEKKHTQIELVACIDHGVVKDADERITEKLSRHFAEGEYPRDKMVINPDDAFYVSTHGQKELILYLEGKTDILSFDPNILEVFCRNIAIAIENLRLNDQLRKTQEEIVYSICEVAETRSKETGNHVRRVAMYSRLIAEHLGLPSRDIEELFLAAPLHDVGKIGIPDSVLNHPGKLEGEKWEVMKTHAKIGNDVLMRSELPIMKAGAIIAAEHHENWDGSGYPNGKKGNEIHIFGRIVALADVYDALMTKRCYKEAWTLEKVEDFIQEEEGKKFDPQIVKTYFALKDQFTEIFNKYGDG